MIIRTIISRIERLDMDGEKMERVVWWLAGVCAVLMAVVILMELVSWAN